RGGTLDHRRHAWTRRGPRRNSGSEIPVPDGVLARGAQDGRHALELVTRFAQSRSARAQAHESADRGVLETEIRFPRHCIGDGVHSMTGVKRPSRPWLSAACARLGVAVVAGVACITLGGVARAQTGKTFIDYIKPAPIVCSPLSSATWGVAGVRPRDICNGIESAKGADVPP